MNRRRIETAIAWSTLGALVLLGAVHSLRAGRAVRRQRLARNLLAGGGASRRRETGLRHL